MISQLLPFLTASVLLTVSPGPDIIYVLVQSITNGKNAGIITSLGLVTGIIIHTSLVAFGVSALIKESENIFLLIKVLGAFYMFFLAAKIIRSSSASIVVDTSTVSKKSGIKLFRTGFIMNVLNPKVTIFFLAFLPGFLWDTNENTVLQFYILGFIFILQALIIFCLVSVLSGKISNYLKNEKSARILKWVQVIVFIGIGIFILL